MINIPTGLIISPKKISCYRNSNITGTDTSLPFAIAHRAITIITILTISRIGPKIAPANQPIIGIAKSNDIKNNINSKLKTAFVIWYDDSLM